MTPKTRLLLLICFLITAFGYSQSIIGKIVDALTNAPLESVTIYYDGTTIGAVTNAKGEFSLPSKVTTQATIVVSYLGYETQYFSQEKLQNTPTISLTEKAESLDAVYIENDDWSREKKMRYFKREFLGRDLAAKDCRILNEEALKLIYLPSKNLLLASSDVPIQIKNDHLVYKVAYTIVDFEIQFKPSLNGWQLVESVFYSGTSSFSELNKKTKNKHQKAREIAYEGSVLQFMRALSKEQLTENNFEIFVNDSSNGSELHFPVPPYKYLEVSKNDNGWQKFEIKHNKLVVLYNKDLQSALIPMDTEHSVFFIDNYGIHSPAEQLFFSGDFGQKRISTMLPLDFLLNIKSKP